MPLEEALGHLQASTMWLAQHGMADPNNAGAGSYAYMQLMGLVSLGWMWLKMAGVAQRLLAEGGEDRAFLEAKLTTARFFATRELVVAGALRRKVDLFARLLGGGGRNGADDGPLVLRTIDRALGRGGRRQLLRAGTGEGARREAFVGGEATDLHSHL